MELEIRADTELDLPRNVALSTNHAPATRVRDVQSWIIELVVIEDIGEHELSVHVHAFGHFEVLLEAEIHIPVRQTLDRTQATIARVDS